MLRIFTDLFGSLAPTATPAGKPEREHTLQLATAVLLMEVMRADGQAGTEAEQQAVMDALRSKFALTDTELDELYELAHDRSEQTHDLYSFTARLNELLDERERVHVFELLWSVAYADGHADAHEAHLLRRLGDLLHLRHADAIGAKLRAERGRQG